MALLHSRNQVCLLGVVLLAISGGCRDDGRPRIVTAQFVDENHDGVIQRGETIRLGLDRPLPEGYLEKSRPDVEIRASAASAAPPDRSPPLVSIEWTWRPSTQRRTEIVLEAAMVEGDTASLGASLTVESAGATEEALFLRGSVRVRFGRQAPGEWIDLTYLPSHPVLERVLWEDRDRPPNLTVNAGDVLRLVFDRPVTLRRTKASRMPEVRVPEDLRLLSETDRLDDGLVPSRFEPGEAPEEILVVLGTRPLLTIDGSLQSPEGRLALRPPSALAINGTRIFPARRVVSARGGWGAISVRAVDIEFAEERRRWRPVEAEFPWPGHRTDHTVTPLPHDRALIVGGRAIDTDTAMDQVLIFDPAALDRGESPFQLAADRLPRPASEHTATLLAGPDTIVGTDDDLVVVIGGRDEDQVLGTITVFAIGEDGDPYIPKPPDTPGPALPAPELHVPRWEHTSVAVGPLRVLVDGGRTRGPSGLVGCAELLTFEVQEGGLVTLAVHTTFRSIPRIQHTLTPLPSIPTDKRERYVLAYGGYGQYRLQGAFLARRDQTLGQIFDGVPPRDIHFTDDDFGTVLVSPVLFDLDDPERSVVLKYNFGFPLLRRGHVAVPIGGVDMETTILIAGGTSTHLEQVSRNKQRGWEIDGELIRRLSQNLPITPEGYEAGNAVLFHFDHLEPRRSRFSIVAHPAPDSQMIERLHQAHAVVPGMGVLLLGGEQAEADGQKGLRIGDIFLEKRRVWLPMAPFLTQPRSGHEAYVVGKDGIPTVFIIGGQPHSPAPSDDAAPFPAVEELRLR